MLFMRSLRMLKEYLVCLILISVLCSGCSKFANDREKEPLDIYKLINPNLQEDLANFPPRDWSSCERLSRTRTEPRAKLTNEEAPVYDKILTDLEVPTLRVRIYKPKVKKDKYPVLLWLHAGGHCTGSPNDSDKLMMAISEEIGCIVVSPDYRLAPENPYPADVDDCYAVLCWMVDQDKSKLPIDKNRVAIGGNSAGGGLAVQVSLKARDFKGPAIAFMMPLSPMLDYRNKTISSYQITDQRAYNRQGNVSNWKIYLKNVKGAVPPYASPAVAKDLSNLPPTYMMVGSLDPFRDETITFAQRMLAASVPVELHVIPKGIHCFEFIFPMDPVSIKTRSEYIQALKNALQ